MYIKHIIIFLSAASLVIGQSGKCDQTPPQAEVLTPSENKGLFRMTIDKADQRDGKIYYTTDQTYVLIISAAIPTRPFKWFMITAEDPEVDNSVYDLPHKSVDVGSLKTLDTDQQSRYSERCVNSVENSDYSDKTRIEVHWVSPKETDKVRIRAMVAENNEVWYTGENLTIILEKNDQPPRDKPPLPTLEICNLCSEARYEVIFNGRWSRGAHPRHYPSKPDENGYSHMVGASHGNNYTLWEQGTRATLGLQLLAEDGNSTTIEREIINAMPEKKGTRTLIRGKKRHHPYMSEPSHSLFRVDRIHHMFSIAVGMNPSPDWFLGTSKFELCSDEGWLKYSELPLFPYDAGTANGISYESQKSKTDPVDNVERVQVGSFDRNSPFYQMNLNDLEPFALLQVRRLDVYPLKTAECSKSEDAEENSNAQEEEEVPGDEPQDGPVLAESRQKLESLQGRCDLSEWGEWSTCVPNDGICGSGTQSRTRYNGQDRLNKNIYYESYDDLQVKPLDDGCYDDQKTKLQQNQPCFIDCS